MTVIVYRDGVLAADTGASYEYITSPEVATKLGHAKHDNWAIGVSGDSCACDTVLSDLSTFAGQDLHLWAHRLHAIIAGRDPEDYPRALIISPRDEIFIMSRSFHIRQVHAPYFVLGMAQEMAYGALHAGASAVRAVEICIQYHAYVSGMVKSIDLRTTSRREAPSSDGSGYQESQEALQRLRHELGSDPGPLEQPRSLSRSREKQP